MTERFNQELRGPQSGLSTCKESAKASTSAIQITSTLAIALMFTGVMPAQRLRDRDPQAVAGSIQLREMIGARVGGLQRLMVPDEAFLPQPRLPNGTPDPMFQTTEAKRYLGKLLFFDPGRMVRINPDFGGLLITRQTASCGSCHLAQASSKSGTLINLAAGGEGLGYTDAQGNFIPRRRPRLDILPKLRQAPLFPGDMLVDELPTLTDVYAGAGVSGPFRARKQPDPGTLLRTGRLDALDSVGRNAPGVLLVPHSTTACSWMVLRVSPMPPLAA